MSVSLPFGLGHFAWDDWFYGLVAAGISGGANAVYGAFGVAIIDPDHFKLGGTDSFELAGMLFLFTGFVSMMNFLRTKALPDRIVTTTVAATKQEGQPAKIVTTVQEVRAVPDTPAAKP